LEVDGSVISAPELVQPVEELLHSADSRRLAPDDFVGGQYSGPVAPNPYTAGVRDRLAKARNVIATRFSWVAARRWVSFFKESERGSETLRVAMATTWNTRCGVAEYASYLVKNSGRSVEFQIFANKGVEILNSASEMAVIRCWSNRWNPDLDELNDALDGSGADVLHIQFNFDFFDLERLAALIDRQLCRRGVVITFHRTKDVDRDGEIVSLAHIRDTLARADCLIVHQDRDAHFLGEIGLSENVRIVRQGTASPPTVMPAEVRAATGLGRRPVLGTFGFLLPHKGTLGLVKVVDRLRSEFPDIFLLALCARHPDGSRAYENELRDEIAQRELQENVLLVTDYLADKTASAILRAADAIVLPYSHTEESSSAALRFVLPVGRPIIATDLPIFADCREALLVVDPDDPSALESAIRRVLSDPPLQEELSDGAATAARRFRWPRSAAHHREIYAAARSAFRRRQNQAACRR
jgi:glycosyltransferase involved in cell wall biosynthesis